MYHILFRITEIVYLITVIGVITVIISENRNPIKTITWIMVLIFLPIIGFVMYIVFGQNYTKRRFMSKRMYSKIKTRPLAEINPNELTHYPSKYIDLIKLLRNSNQAQLLYGSSVEFFVTGRDKFDALFRDLDKATQHIHIEYYAWDDDVIGNLLKDLLIKKSGQGVKIRVIVDGVGSWRVKNSFYEQMRSAGIEVEEFMKVKFPMFTSHVNYRNHRKVVVIDGQVGYTGGMNVADRYINGPSWGNWRDTHIRIEGKGVQGLQSVFLIDWFMVSKSLITARKYFPPLENFGDNIMQVVSSGPYSSAREILQGFMQAIFGAESYIYIQTPYFIPPESLSEALIAASIRGVDVRLMVPRKSDTLLVQLASRSYFKKLLIAGVKVYFYEPGFLHSKLIVIDDALTMIGSANLDVRSFEQNLEVVAFVYNEVTAMRGKAIFVEDQNSSTAIVLREWIKRPVWLRFKESFLRLFTPLL
ncbi:MAG TPA: cardiolipin synthase [Dysgonamonadaceae bacterium]|nr:cardiolipin synthase [Dysgonamonadaceae bacterium]